MQGSNICIKLREAHFAAFIFLTDVNYMKLRSMYPVCDSTFL